MLWCEGSWSLGEVVMVKHGARDGGSIYLGEERRDDGSGHLLLSLQLNLNQHWTATVRKHGRSALLLHLSSPLMPLATEFPPLDVVLLRHLVRQLDVGVAVTEASHVGHLGVRELQQGASVVVLHLHDVEDALHTLIKATGRRWSALRPRFTG